jgi:hypothetical protein
VAVGLDSLDEAACVLADLAREAAVVTGLVAARTCDADLVAGALLSPVTGAVVADALAQVAGPGGLGGEAASLVELAAAVRGAVAAYRAGEEVASATVEGAQDTVLGLAGALAPELVVAVCVLDAFGLDLTGELDRFVFDHPEVADLAGGAEGLVVGLRSNPLTAPLVPARPPHRSEDGLQPDRSDGGYEDAIASLADSAALWGVLDDRGRAWVTPEPTPRPGAAAPSSLRDLAADQRNVGDGEQYAGHVRVIEVPQPRGSAWVVEISGTQAWDPGAGDNPFDVTTDVRSMAQQATVLADGVQQALGQAQAASTGAAGPLSSGRESPPVMLVGHSLGGIAAAGLASSPAFTAEHRVTHVVTLGAPVARMPVPATTHVLSLEHTRDAVPRLDGQPNPDRATWVTVTRDPVDDGIDRVSQAHDLGGYEKTAALVDGSTDPSVAGWRSTSAAFFAGAAHGEPVIRDYLVQRVRP